MTTARPSAEVDLPVVRMKAVAAVEHDPVRRYERILDVRLAAAIALAPRIETAEVLLIGAAVPAHRLAPRLRDSLRLEGDVILDLDLAYQVVAQGPQA